MSTSVKISRDDLWHEYLEMREAVGDPVVPKIGKAQFAQVADFLDEQYSDWLEKSPDAGTAINRYFLPIVHRYAEPLSAQPSPPPPPPPPKITEPTEQTFLQERGATVTSARFITLGHTYALRNIASVALKIIPANTTPAIVTFIIAIIAGAIGWSNASNIENATTQDWIGCLGIGIAFLVVTFIIFVCSRASYAVTLTTSAGEARALVTPDIRFAKRVTAALNQAIIAAR